MTTSPMPPTGIGVRVHSGSAQPQDDCTWEMFSGAVPVFLMRKTCIAKPSSSLILPKSKVHWSGEKSAIGCLGAFGLGFTLPLMTSAVASDEALLSTSMRMLKSPEWPAGL